MDTFTNHPSADGTAPPSAAAQALREAVFLQEVQAESLGWQPLDTAVYLHVGAADALHVVDVVGVATPDMAGHNVVWLQY